MLFVEIIKRQLWIIFKEFDFYFEYKVTRRFLAEDNDDLITL